MEQAIDHPYFENLRKLDDPPRCPNKFDWGWEAKMQQESDKHKNPYFDKQMICRLIYNESLDFHPDTDSEAKKKENDKADKNASGEAEITELPLKKESK